MDRVGNLKEVWVVCPQCKEFFNVERLFWEEKVFAKLKLHCPFCSLEFGKGGVPENLGAGSHGNRGRISVDGFWSPYRYPPRRR